TDSSSIALTELESTAQSYKTVYENYLRRYMEAVQEQSFPVSEARIISPATRPLRKSSPKTFLVLAITGLVGLALGFGIGVLRDLSERVFRSVQQVESLLRANCIALVPLDDLNSQNSDASSSIPDKTWRSQLETWFAGSLSFVFSIVKRPFSLTSPSNAHSASEVDEISASRGRKIERNGGLLWSVVDAPLSRFSEAIRAIKLAIDMNGAFEATRVIGFTSSLPNEGKSTIAFSLAQLMAQVGARTILVDCDIRNPSLSRALAPRAKKGLIDILTGRVELEKAIWKDPSTNMVFLPVLMKFRFANSSEILSSVQMKKLFENLRESYDYIIVDFPPLAPIVDARAASPLVDSFVYTIEWGRTKIDVVEHALEQAQEVHDRLLGVVLNKVNMKSFRRHAGPHESYYYNKDYGRYGYQE